MVKGEREKTHDASCPSFGNRVFLAVRAATATLTASVCVAGCLRRETICNGPPFFTGRLSLEMMSGNPATSIKIRVPVHVCCCPLRMICRMQFPKYLLSLLLIAGAASPLASSPDQLVYIGTYTNNKKASVESKGIYVFGLDSKTGKLEAKGLAAEAKSPSFLAISPSKRFLYCVSEVNSGGGLSAYALDAKTGRLTLLNQESSQGKGPCHVSVDHTGKTLLAANYGSGHVASLPIKEDGSLGQATSVHLQGPASQADPKRQGAPHAHSINVDAGNRFAFACDLGCDKVFVYKLDPAAALLAPSSSASVPPGSGPRHFFFHPSGKYAYANNEMTMTVTSFAYDADKGELKAMDTISTLPPGLAVDPKFSTAEVQVHPNGKFAYVSNRGHDTIACFKVDEGSGKLVYLENTPSVVSTPRNFGIDPTGQWMITAGQSSNNLAVLAIDQATGKLTPTGQVMEVGAPVCVKFMTLD